MNDQLLLLSILAGALALFAWNRWRYDLVAVGVLLATVLAGIVPAQRAFQGFGHPAVITVVAVLIVSHGLRRSGVVSLVARWLVPFTHRPLVHIVALTGLVTVASAFMNNVGALALLLPVALATAAEHDRSPAVLLMPLAFGSLLGGMTTLIGTPPNIIIATYRADVIGEAFHLFDFAPVGLVVAVAGLLFITLVGWRLIPAERRAANTGKTLFQTERYLTELKVADGSRLIDQPLSDLEDMDDVELDLIGFSRGRGHSLKYAPQHTLQAGDVLVVRAEPKSIEQFIDAQGLELLTTATPSFEALAGEDLTLVEAVVSPRSPLVGRDLSFLRRRAGGSLALVAIGREGHMVRGRLVRQKFQPGDVLLLQGGADSIEDVLAGLDLLLLAGRDFGLGTPRRIGLALGVFGAAIAAAVLGWLPITIALAATGLAYVLLGILSIRELYAEVDWAVIVLLGAMIPVGQALETTGTTAAVAGSVLGLTGDVPLALVLVGLMVATMFLSDVVNNAATTIVMAPIGVEIARELGASPDPFLMCIAVGASCAFLTPIGHQSNTLVMGPGGYRFTDYWRMGLPLEAIIVVVSVPAILYFWPPGV